MIVWSDAPSFKLLKKAISVIGLSIKSSSNSANDPRESPNKNIKKEYPIVYNLEMTRSIAICQNKFIFNLI